MLKFLAQDLMKWPEFTAADAILSAFVVLGIAMVVGAVRFYSRRKGQKDASWNILRAHALRRGLDFNEVALLQAFFQSAGRVEESLMDPRALFFDLRDYLTHRHDVSDRLAVRVLDKMFPSAGSEIEVLSPGNLQPGEFCGVEYGRRHYLGRIVKTRENDILISLTDWHPETAAPEAEVRIYVFRGRMGGFLLHGIIKKVQRDGMIVRFAYKIDSLGEKHLMMIARLPLTLHEWPWPPEDGTGGESPVAETSGADKQGAGGKIAGTGDEGNADEEEEEREQIILQGRSERVSDRALTLIFDSGSESTATKEIHRHDLWRIEMELHSGFRFVCRGRLQPVPRSTNQYLFRYVDPSENAVHAIFADIREHEAERENLF